ncbi:unnamed protein product, partial [Lampetra planeri]
SSVLLLSSQQNVPPPNHGFIGSYSDYVCPHPDRRCPAPRPSKTLTSTETVCARAAARATAAARQRALGEQQAPPLPSSPSSNSSTSQKKKSPTSSSASGTATPALTKQIFPWMKETRQNAKQKSNNCTTAGEVSDEKSPSGPASKRVRTAYTSAQLVELEKEFHFNPIPVPPPEGGNGQFTEPHRAPDQDLVPEPEDEIQKGPEVERDRALPHGTLPGPEPTA